MRIVDRPTLLAAINGEQAISMIEHAFRAHSLGQVRSIAVGHLQFASPLGDVHVKGGHIDGAPVFAIKVASNYYTNPEIGLPSSNGMMLLFDAGNGQQLALLLDEGALTDMRTAAAGAIAARLIAPSKPRVLGVVGAGTQARLQGRWIARHLGMERVVIWARNSARSAVLAREFGEAGLSADAVSELDALCAQSDVIVTATSSRDPLIDQRHMRDGLRIVAVGADAPGKREIAAAVVEAAHLRLVDSHAQCSAHGECEGLPDTAPLIEIGTALRGGVTLAPNDIAIADLTGLGAQDAAIAQLAWENL